MDTDRFYEAPTPRHCGKPLVHDAEGIWWCQVCRGCLESSAAVWQQVYGGDLEAVGATLRATYASRSATPPRNPQLGRC